MNASVLKINKAGQPIRWISKEAATQLLCNNKVIWSFGEQKLHMRGGFNRSGKRTVVTLDPIIAVEGHVTNVVTRLPLTRKVIFRRDKRCMYCGAVGPMDLMTLDHIIPKSQGGGTTFANLVQCCYRCNQAKADRCPEKWGVKLLGVPYTPTFNEFLYLQNRNILGDQLSFLEKGFKNIDLNVA